MEENKETGFILIDDNPRPGGNYSPPPPSGRGGGGGGFWAGAGTALLGVILFSLLRLACSDNNAEKQAQAEQKQRMEQIRRSIPMPPASTKPLK